MGATLLRALRHGIQRIGDGVVGTDGRGGPVPGLPVRVVGEGPGHGGVGSPPLQAGRRLVDRGPDQRVSHGDAVVVDRQQARPLGLVPRRGVDADGGRRVVQHARPAGVVRGREQQQRLRVGAGPPDPVQEGPFDARGQRQPGRQGRGPAQLVGLQPGRQLEQGQGVAARLRHEAVGDDVGRR